MQSHTPRGGSIRRAAAIGFILLFIAATFTGPVQAPPVSPDDPVVNSHFELRIPPQFAAPLQGTPADECIGIGHQLFYGSETWQQKVEDAASSAANNDTDGAQANATAAADQVASDPLNETEFLTGYGHCVANSEEGVDAIWFNPVATAAKPAIHWSHGDANTQFGDFERAGDREVKIGADPAAAGHNLWQAWSSPHQAYSGNFSALKFWVEAGEVPSSARVIVSLTATPVETLHPFVLLFLDCQLVFDADDLAPNAFGGVSVDPADASFRSRDPACDDAKVAWDNGDRDDRHDVLGRLRLVQLSFWSFHRGADDVVLDGVRLAGTTTVAEEVARGNTG